MQKTVRRDIKEGKLLRADLVHVLKRRKTGTHSDVEIINDH